MFIIFINVMMGLAQHLIFISKAWKWAFHYFLSSSNYSLPYRGATRSKWVNGIPLQTFQGISQTLSSSSFLPLMSFHVMINLIPYFILKFVYIIYLRGKILKSLIVINVPLHKQLPILSSHFLEFSS